MRKFRSCIGACALVLAAAPAHAAVGDVVLDLIDAILMQSCAYPRAEQRMLHAVGLPTTPTPCVFLASLNDFGQRINGSINSFEISRDGRVLVFETAASDVRSDVNAGGRRHVWVRNLVTGEVDHVSRNHLGDPATSSSSECAISGDGLLAGFKTQALILDEPPGIFNDGYVRDLAAGMVVRGSFLTNGSRAGASDIAFNADGRYFVYNSGNNGGHVYVHDLIDVTTVRVSVQTGGGAANPGGGDPQISGDGRHVVWESSSTNLVPGDGNGQRDIIAHDRDPDGNGVFDEANGVTTLLSRGPFGVQGNDRSERPAVSDDGRYVAFQSESTNLGFTAPGNVRQIYLRDRGEPDANGAYDDDANGTTTLISRHALGAAGDDDSYRPYVSPDGRYIAFQSLAENLIDDDTNNGSDVFVFDRVGGTLTRASVRADGSEANSGSDAVLIRSVQMSEDGRFFAFMSTSNNLADIAPSGNGVFVRDRDITLDF